MSSPDPTPAVSARIGEVLEELHHSADPRAAALADELTASLVRLYGEGLARIVTSLGAERAEVLCADPLVESLLLIHDLHPWDTGTRIRRALEHFAAYGKVLLDAVDAAGVARVSLAAGPGCGGSRQALRAEIEQAVGAAAPELSGVEVRVSDLPPLLQISPRTGRDPWSPVSPP